MDQARQQTGAQHVHVAAHGIGQGDHSSFIFSAFGTRNQRLALRLVQAEPVRMRAGRLISS
jgi:hypothetical protein